MYTSLLIAGGQITGLKHPDLGKQGLKFCFAPTTSKLGFQVFQVKYIVSKYICLQSLPQRDIKKLLQTSACPV